MVKQSNRLSVKVLGVLCALALLVGALYVPLALSVSAASIPVTANEVTFFGFEPEEGAVTSMGTLETSANLTRGGDGVGVVSWGLTVKTFKKPAGGQWYSSDVWAYSSDPDNHGTQAMWGGKVDQVAWATGGGFRLHNNDGVYNLSPNTTYVMSFRINVISGPLSYEGNTALRTSTLNMGYGFVWNKNVSGNENNTVNSMKTVVTQVLQCETDEDFYTLYTEMGPQKYRMNSGWKTVVYSFTTPATMPDGAVNSLGFYSSNYYGTSYFVDDVQVVKLGSGKGVAALKDGYNKEVTMKIGNVGETIPVITPTAENPAHTFTEWCYDEACKESAAGATFGAEKTVLYAHWDAPVNLTFHIGEGNEDIVLNGQAGETITFPEDPVDQDGEVDKWFMEWYKTSAYTEVFNLTEFPFADGDVYAKWDAAYNVPKQTFDGSYATTVKKTPAGKGDDGGKSYRSANWFGTFMEVVNAPTEATERGKVVKLDWKSDSVRVMNDAATLDAAEKYNTTENKFTMDGLALEKGRVYTCSFDYYVESAETDLIVYPVEGAAKSVNGYNYYVEDGVSAVISKDTETGVWKTGTFTFTYKKNSADTPNLFLVASLAENKDVVVYFDNVAFNPQQPYESSLTYVTGGGLPNKVIIGNRGDAIEGYTPSNDRQTFLGWYTSTKYVEKFTATNLGRKNLVAYGQWTAAPVDFTTYAQSGSFASNFERKTAEGAMPEIWGIKDSNNTYPHYEWYIGRGWYVYHADDASQDGDGYEARLKAYVSGFDSAFTDGVAKWNNERIISYTENKDGTKTPNYLYDSFSEQPLPLMTVEPKTLYKVSYWYKNNGSTHEASMGLYTSPRNASSWYKFTACATPLENVGTAATGWKYVENYVYIADETKNNQIFLRYTVKGKRTADMKVDISVDNVRVEKILPPYALFDGLTGDYNEFTFGEAGQAVTLPAKNPVKFGHTFIGWYGDADLTVPFSAVYSEEQVPIAYAKYSRNTYVKYDLNNYLVENPAGWFTRNPANTFYETTGGVGNSPGIRINREGGNGSDAMKNAAYFEVSHAYAADAFVCEPGKRYVMQFKYKVNQAPSKDAKCYLMAGHLNNYWHQATRISTASYTIMTTVDTGVWRTGTIIAQVPDPFTYPNSNRLYFGLEAGNDIDVVFDDIEITTLPAGYQAYLVDTADTSGVPAYVSGKIGTSFRAKLPAEPKKDNHVFIGYSFYDSKNNKGELTDEKMVFTEENIRIITGMVRLETVQDFEKDYMTTLAYYGDYAAYDFDYELYDATAEGNSTENVTSPTHSFHRKGETMYFENAQILQQNLMLADSQRYTVTMKLKLGKHFHTDGAVKFASCRTPYYGWSTTGDYYPIATIKELEDGEWHEVSYTFNSVEAFLTVQTPGYCEVFIDDVVIVRVDSDTPLSTAPKFTEYVPAERDADGNLLKKSASDIDVTSIIDVSLYQKGFNWLLAALIAGGVLLLGGAGVAVWLILKKQKAKKTTA